MSKKMVALWAFVGFLCGVIAGFFLAPTKGGIGNNCGNTVNQYAAGDPGEE